MPLNAVAESLAMTSTALFFGAALYISLVEHPARLEAGVDVALRQFPHSYRRAARLQASLAVIGSVTGVAAWLLGSPAWWALSALLLFAVVPLTLVVIFPTNKRLHDPDLKATDPAALGLLRRWGTLHWLRTGLSLLAFGVQVLQSHAR
jgi:Anthrone oxygenase